MYALTETGGFAADAEVTGLATPLVDGLGRPDLVRDRACVGRRRLADADDGRRPAAIGRPSAPSRIGAPRPPRSGTRSCAAGPG
jgi:hypothetical protein